MEEEIKKKILEISKEIKLCTSHAVGENLELDDKISEIENPLNSVLFYYCFSTILEIEFCRFPIEKVRYVAEFEYKGHICKVIDRKFEYTVYLEKEIKAEFIEVLQKIREELSKLFAEKAKKAYKSNSFKLPNQVHMYERKIGQRKKQVLECYIKQLVYEQNNKEILPILPSENAATVQRYLETAGWDPNIEWSNFVWAVEEYMNTVYSYIEHLETLLIPFSGLMNTHRDIWKENWITKAKLIWGEEIVNQKFMKELRYYKDTYRNRMEHGFFSQEMKIKVKLEGIGYYPIFIGSKYLSGLEEENEYCIDISVFDNFEKAFMEFIVYNKKMYGKAMAYINNGFDVSTDVLNDFVDIKTIEDAEKYVKHLWEINDYMRNM